MPIREDEDLISIANRLMANPDWRSVDLYNALLAAFSLGIKAEIESRAAFDAIESAS